MSLWARLLRVLGVGARAVVGAVLDEISDRGAEPAPKPKRAPLKQITDEELGK